MSPALCCVQLGMVPQIGFTGFVSDGKGGPEELLWAWGEPATNSSQFCESQASAWLPVGSWILGFRLNKAFVPGQVKAVGRTAVELLLQALPRQCGNTSSAS